MIGKYEHLKEDAKITISEELVNDFKAINAIHAETCGLALRQPVPGKQYVRKLPIIWIRTNDRGQ